MDIFEKKGLLIMEKITKYEIVKTSKEISFKNRRQIMSGCTLVDGIEEVLLSFDKKEIAIKELEKYESKILRLSGPAGTYYGVTEYCVQENIYNEDGDWVCGGDIWKTSELQIFVYDVNSGKCICACSTYEEAEKKIGEAGTYDEWFISFC